MRDVELGFTRLWTIKEAIVKAQGAGLAIPLNAMDVVGSSSRVLLRTPGHKSQISWVKEVGVIQGYAASVGAIGAEFDINLINCQRRIAYQY